MLIICVLLVVIAFIVGCILGRQPVTTHTFRRRLKGFIILSGMLVCLAAVVSLIAALILKMVFIGLVLFTTVIILKKFA